MVDIFNYTDLLKYFEDYYADKKAEDPDFAYSTIAENAGFNNKGFAYNIFNGLRPISPANCRKLSLALKHNKCETEYFHHLVAFRQTVDLKKKNLHFEKLITLSRHGAGFTRAQVLTRDHYAYFSRWYHLAVRSIIGMYPFKDDYFWLSRMVIPRITVGQAKKSVELLKRLRLVQEGDNKVLELTNVSITSGREIWGTGLRNFHFDAADLAKNAIKTMDRDTRHITGLTVGVSKDAYDTICTKVEGFQKEIIDIANNSKFADRVYQINFHLFPLSKADKKRKCRP